ncbi:MAG: hypothetical protein HFJ41_00235 [Clostridia bacterium]|nr:hypothetical protein [Clostridia bacterium]
MIKVDNRFYEEGCTMDGKGNRVMLKKDGNTCIEMTFNGKNVKLRNMDGKVKIIEFSKICEITIGYQLPAVFFKD